jgi:hypothetical protein
MVREYIIKKPVTVKAIEWTGGNEKEIFKFVKDKYYIDKNGDMYIETLEGDMKASVGDMIIQSVNGEFYPCKPDIFDKTYDEA